MAQNTDNSENAPLRFIGQLPDEQMAELQARREAEVEMHAEMLREHFAKANIRANRRAKLKKVWDVTCAIGTAVVTVVLLPIVLLSLAGSSEQQPKKSFRPFKPKVYRPTGGPKGYK